MSKTVINNLLQTNNFTIVTSNIFIYQKTLISMIISMYFYAV